MKTLLDKKIVMVHLFHATRGLILVIILCHFSSNSCGQPTLEEAFDDSGAKLDFSIGSNLLCFSYGTPNLGLSL